MSANPRGIVNGIEEISIKNIIRPYLEGNEQLLWCGQPGALQAACELAPLLLFGTVFFATGIIFLLAGFNSKSGGYEWIVATFGIPSCLVGLFLLAIPVMTFIQAKRTYYVATTERLLIIEKGRGASLVSFPLRSLAGVSRTECGTSGTLVWSLRDLSAPDVTNKSKTNASAKAPDFVKFTAIYNPKAAQRLIEGYYLKAIEDA